MPGRSTPYPGLSGSSPPRETLTVSPPLLRVGGELTSAGSRPVRVRPVAASAAAVERAAGATGVASTPPLVSVSAPARIFGR
jgi:hypothetical protein